MRRCLEPVSYTHLDVYKRQMISYVECRSNPVAEPAPKKALPDWLGDLAEAVMVVAAVLCGATGFTFWVFIVLALV